MGFMTLTSQKLWGSYHFSDLWVTVHVTLEQLALGTGISDINDICILVKLENHEDLMHMKLSKEHPHCL